MNIGLCSWSIDRDDPLAALKGTAELGFRHAQVGFFGERAIADTDPLALAGLATDAGIEISAVFVAFDGEDYGSPDALQQSGGLVPDEQYTDRIDRIQRVLPFADALQAPCVLIHGGTPSNQNEQKLAERLAAVTQLIGPERQLLLETGRENARDLMALIQTTGLDNIAVNFDGANFVALGTDEPVEALKTCRPKLAAVHIKDAISPSAQGEWGKPAALGTGDAHVPRIINKLRTWRFDQPLMIECARSMAGTRAVKAAADYLRTMLP